MSSELLIKESKTEVKIPSKNIPGKDRRGACRDNRLIDYLFASVCWSSELFCGVVFGGCYEVCEKQSTAGRVRGSKERGPEPQSVGCGRVDSLLGGQVG